MSKAVVNINDGDKELVVILPNTSTDEVLYILTETPDNETSVIEKFLIDNGLVLSHETPQSSNIQSVNYNAITQEIGFVFENDSEVKYRTTFDQFVEDLKTTSFGKLQWSYRREHADPTRLGERVKVITPKNGALGATGKIGIVTDEPISSGVDEGLRVRIGDRVWGIGEGAVVELA